MKQESLVKLFTMTVEAFIQQFRGFASSRKTLEECLLRPNPNDLQFLWFWFLGQLPGPGEVSVQGRRKG